MKQFKSKLLVILSIFSCLNFNGMYVPPAVAPSTTNAVLEFISQNSDKIAEVGKGILLFFTSREIAKNLPKSENKEEEPSSKDSNDLRNEYALDVGSVHETETKQVEGCGLKFPPLPEISEPEKIDDKESFDRGCLGSYFDNQEKMGLDCGLSNGIKEGQMNDSCNSSKQAPDIGCRPDYKDVTKDPQDTTIEVESEQEQAKSKESDKKEKKEGSSGKYKGKKDEDIAEQEPYTVNPATEISPAVDVVEVQGLATFADELAERISSLDVKEIFCDNLSVTNVQEIPKALRNLTINKLREISNIVDILSENKTYNNFEDQFIAIMIRNMAKAVKDIKDDEVRISADKAANPGKAAKGSNVSINGLLTTPELVQEMKDGLILQDAEGNIYAYDIEHILGGTINKRKLSGFHFTPTKRIFELLKLSIDRKKPRDAVDLFQDTNVVEICFGLRNQYASKLNDEKYSVVYVGAIQDFKKICASGWQNFVESGKLDQLKNFCYENKDLSAKELNKLYKDKEDKIDSSGMSKYGYKVTFKNIDFSPKNRSVGSFYISGYDDRIAKAYNQGDAIPSHNITNPLKETDTIFKLEEHSAYQDYKIKQAAIRRAPRNCAYYDISGYELNKKIENFKQAIKNNLFSGQYLPYDSIEIVTRKIDKVSDKETESEFSFAKVFNKAKYNLTKPEDPDRSIKLGGTCTIDYKREKINLEDCDYSEVYCLLKNKEFRYLILHDKQFEARYIEWQNYLIDLAASTNCTPRDNMFGHPEIAKIIMVNTQNDHYPPGFAFNHLRENLLKIYFDKKTGGLKELRTANEEQKVTKAIVDFVYDISPNKQAYINNLNRLRDKRVYHLDPVLRENQILDPKNFDQYSKRPPRINLYKDKEFLDNIITNDTVQVYAQVSNILFNHDFALARRTIESLKCSNKVKEDLNYAYRTMYFKEHDAHGIRNAFKDDPIVGTLSQEDYKELNNNLQDLDKFNALLMVRHIYAQQWAPQFNIKNLDNKILKHHLYEFAYLAEDPELAIDSLLKLSSDCESQESKKAYSSLFNDKGILRILERNKLISKYDFSDILSTSQATELRRYLNYALTFNVGKESENHIKQILDYIDEASKLLSTDKEKAESYIEIVKNLYNAISLENSDKTILKCDSFLSVYDDIQKQNLQNTFTNAVSKCVRFMDNINSVQEYMNNIKIVEKIILHANQGQIQLRQNNVGLAEIISNRLSEIFYNDSKEINIEKAKELALFLENIN